MKKTEKWYIWKSAKDKELIVCFSDGIICNCNCLYF